MISSKKISIARTVLLLDLMSESKLSFMYVAVTDDVTCQACLKHDKQIMSDEDAEREFPYLLKGPNDLVWYPNVHPWCRCLLILLGGV
jgi:hypothetical protein